MALMARASGSKSETGHEDKKPLAWGPFARCNGSPPSMRELIMIRVSDAALPLAVLACLAAAPTAKAQDAGEAVFKRYCAVCHTVEAGKNKIGPSLAGILGRKAGSVPGYNYTDANKNSGVTWDEQNLDTYLTDPKKFVPGTKMLFAGVKSDDDRKALIAYLKQQK
jgi:cytochrome c